jgi:hypothetical protein
MRRAQGAAREAMLNWLVCMKNSSIPREFWLKSWVKAVRNKVLETLPLRTAIQLEFLLYHKRLPRLSPPLTFNEKIVYRKLNERNPLMARLSDKVLAKEYIASVLGPEWVIPTLWSGSALPPREERKWPIPYVLKASHGSGWNYFVRSAEEQDWDEMERAAAQWLKTIYGRRSLEWAYAQLKPGLLVEPFVGRGEVAPPDYKLFVFGGRTAFVQVDLGRLQEHRQFFYDPEWKRQSFRYICPYDPEEIPPPESLRQMVEAADKLGEPFGFVRVDLYEIEGKPYFGEFTFYPNGGQFTFKPPSTELRLGTMWPI